MISHDSGISWKMIENGQKILHGKTSEKFSPIFSDENLHGILLSNSTDLAKQSLQPIISLDNGLNWKPIVGLESSSYTFASTGHGDILIAISDQKYTQGISVSTDHGHSFRTVPITEDKFLILHHRRLLQSQDSILLSTARSTPKAKYSLLLTLDLSKLLSQKCLPEDL